MQKMQTFSLNHAPSCGPGSAWRDVSFSKFSKAELIKIVQPIRMSYLSYLCWSHRTYLPPPKIKIYPGGGFSLTTKFERAVQRAIDEWIHARTRAYARLHTHVHAQHSLLLPVLPPLSVSVRVVDRLLYCSLELSREGETAARVYLDQRRKPFALFFRGAGLSGWRRGAAGGREGG